MNTSKTLRMGCATMVTLALIQPVQMAMAQQVYYGGNGQQGDSSTKSLLAAQMGVALVGQLVSVFSQGAGCVFSRVFSFMGSSDNPNCKSQNSNVASANNPPTTSFNQQATAQTPFQGGQASMPSQYTFSITPEQAAAFSSRPILSFYIEKLSTNMPDATVVDTLINNSSLSNNQEPEFSIKTGESFAIKFSTSTPGRVRLYATDSDRKTNASDLYEAIPANDNRMPRQHQGGILMSGNTGTEYLDIEFTPCVSVALQTNPSVAAFSTSLPACSNEIATKQYKPALPGGKGGLAEYGAKAMIIPSGGDPTQPIGFSPADYTKGEAMRFRIKVNHIAPSI
jgi:hypothetical protein